MNKLEMAHDFAMKLIAVGATNKTEDIIRLGWECADAMQKEWDERNGAATEAILNITNSSQLECQPDWSKAPSEYKWYAVDENGNHGFFVMKPYKSLASNSWCKDENDFSDFIHLGYLSISKTDNWQDSLRKRP